MSAALNTTERGPKTTKANATIPALTGHPTWADILSVVDEFIPALSAHARSEQARGTAVVEFVEGLAEAASDWRTSDGLKKIFAAPGDLNLSHDEIEYALDELKAGSDPDAVLANIENSRAAGSNAGWDKVCGQVEAYGPAYDAASATALTAYRAARDETKFPAGLQNPHTPSMGALENARLPLDEKVRRMALIEAYNAERDAILERHNYPELDRLSDEARDLFEDARDQLLEMQPPTLAGLVAQMRHSLFRGDTDADPDTCEGIAEILANWNDNWRGDIYVHAVRLAGLPRPEGWGDMFDPEEWAEAFEAHPGHRLTVRGPEYQDPIAWGPDMPADADLKITDPDAIARYDAHVRSLYTDAAWQRDQARAWGRKAGMPFILSQPEAIDWAYPDGGPDHERFTALWNARRDRSEKEPTGAHLWRDLPKWKKRVVQSYVDQHQIRFPAGRDWKVSDWVEAFEGLGGSLHEQDDGSILMGGPVPMPVAMVRMMEVAKTRDLNDGIAHFLSRRTAEQNGEAR